MSDKKLEILTPTPELREWADCEVGVIIHLDMQVFEPTYDFRADWNYQPDAKLFNPSSLDTDQWVASAKAAGAKYAVLVAKHCSGFCLWPTDAHPYSIKSSPWKDGKGDIVGDFFKSCAKYGVRPGLYYSASCNAYKHVDNPGRVVGGSAADNAAYNEMVLSQLTELWTRYGKVFEIWFDGGCLPVEQGGPDIAGLLHRLQPDAVVFQGPRGAKSALRWVGNENATAPRDCWATMDFEKASFDGSGSYDPEVSGNPFGDAWRPAESDMPGREASKAFQGGWFWRKGEEQYVFPAQTLFERYLKSAGRNSNLLIGMNIDNTGRLPETDAAQLSRFGGMVKSAFGTPIACGKVENSRYEYRLDAPANREAKYLVVQEDITFGERILGYKLDCGISGHAIGHKRIFELPQGTRSVTFEITEAKAEPRLRSIELY